jgi:glyoxylate/hydroxypyruvate reductase
VRYLAAWLPPDDLDRRFPNLELLFSVGAGIDQFDLGALPPDLPVVRMTEPGITAGMVEYVTMAVLGLHRDLPAYLDQQRRREWRLIRVHPAAKHRVGVLARAVLDRLAAFGFPLAGWSRNRRAIPRVECYAGRDELPAMLERTDILVCLLPLTDQTRRVLGADLFARLPQGAGLVHVGRGPQLDHDALLAALDDGRLSAAWLDVTEPEPLPADHRLWSHPKVVLTPHIASMTQPETAVDLVLDSIRRHRAGEPLPGLVDRARGY